MKGQASLEYLLLAVVGLAMLSLSAAALLGLKESSEDAVGAYAFRSAADSLSADINELCALGSGNRREAAAGTEIAVDSEWAGDGWAIRFSSGNLSTVRGSRCGAKGKTGNGNALLENEGGRITIR